MSQPPLTVRRSERGATLMWTLVSVVVAVLAALVLLRSLLYAMSLRQTMYETGVAQSAAHAMAEELLAQEFTDVFERYNSTSSDDPGTGSSPGADFAVSGLTAVAGDSDGLAGEIVFPVSANATGTISERLTAFPGLPRDLNLDGDVTDSDVTADRAILPVHIVVRWQGSTGEQSVEVLTILAEGL